MKKISGILICTVLGVVFSVAMALAQDVKKGEAVYKKACKGCHGADGTPKASLAKTLKIDMKDLKDPAVQAMSDADIKKWVTDGQGKMKAVKSVKGSAADDVAAYVKSMKK